MGGGGGKLWGLMRLRRLAWVLAAGWMLAGAGVSAGAAEHVTLRNGFELDCARREVVGERVRLFLVPAAGVAADGSAGNYVEVATDAVVRVETMAPVAVAGVVDKQDLRSAKDDKTTGGPTAKAGPTVAEMREMLAHAGVAHRVDADLLASVVRAESGGRVAAVSRAGALGLMQLMPTTAAAMGVRDAFAAEQNIDGGSAYLDWLLTRYHDDMARALAAYNAGPAAVDRYHGVPPYRETRAYVARVIREFNRRKLASK